MPLFSDIHKILDHKDAELSRPDLHSLQLLYDSRLIINGYGGVFFALTSSRNDGHTYIPQLIEKGVEQWVISDPEWAEWLREKGNQNWILVDNVLEALQKTAAWHRSRFTLPVVAITGSNGKTIVKEWLNQLIGPDRFVCKSPKSFNSQLGVALSVWNLSQGHNLGLFEAGISRPGEMAALREMIQPTLGILTNLGTAHDEGFSSQTEKLVEKLQLFTQVRTLIMHEGTFNRFHQGISSTLPQANVQTWSWGLPEADGSMKLIFKEKKHPFRLPFTDDASMENLGNALAMAIELGISPGIMQNRLHLLNQPEMRLSLKEGWNGNVLIDDSYTNDLTGLEAALQFAVMQRKPGQEVVLILSDLEESSESVALARQKINRLIENHEVNRLITVGHQFEEFPFPRHIHSRNYRNVEELKADIGIRNFENAVLLVKGARKFGLEELVKNWQKKIHGTRLEINLDAMVHNLNFYRSQLAPGTGIMAMVKALGYGSGDQEVARMLAFHGVTYLAVAYVDEGIQLREAGITTPIMVMNPTEETIASLVENDLEPEIYHFHILDLYLKAIKHLSPENVPPIHIKIDTGMHRLGFLPDEVPDLVTILNQYPSIHLASVFSHLAGADEGQLDEYSRLQMERFDKACTTIQSGTGKKFRRHLLNSAGILRFPDARFDMVRLGIGLYGIEVNSWYQNQLQPVSCLKSTISQIKTVRAGESVGYGRKTILTRDSRVATIAIGYSDGFRRDFSNGKGRVKCGGVWVPVLGNVCMDMTMIDVTDCTASEGDDVVVFDDANSLMQLAQVAGTIPYEILTGIGHRVKRIFYRG